MINASMRGVGILLGIPGARTRESICMPNVTCRLIAPPFSACAAIILRTQTPQKREVDTYSPRSRRSFRSSVPANVPRGAPQVTPHAANVGCRLADAFDLLQHSEYVPVLP